MAWYVIRRASKRFFFSFRSIGFSTARDYNTMV